MKRGLFHIFAKGLTDLISLRACWCVSIDNQAISYVTRKAYSPLNQMLLCEGGEYLTFKP